MKPTPYLFLTFLLLNLTSPHLRAEEFPLFLGANPNPNAFTLFANGGWDGNWYVGYDRCWVQKLLVPEKGNFKSAFLGAKLGRAKTVPQDQEKPWLRKNIPGEIFISISSSNSWKKSVVISLVRTEDIPLEGDSQTAIEGVEESRWFWKEIPLEAVQFHGENYVALWSSSEIFKSAQTSPILAGAWGNAEVDSWLVGNIGGSVPKSFSAKDWQPVTLFEPAIALKLIPAKSPPEPKVNIVKIEEETKFGKLEKKILWCSVDGESVTGAWVEVSSDGKNWQGYGKLVKQAPYVFRLNILEIPMGAEGKSWVRVKAVNDFESVGTSPMVSLF